MEFHLSIHVSYMVGGTLVGKVLIDDFSMANHTWENMVKEIVGDRLIEVDINFWSFVGNNKFTLMDFHPPTFCNLQFL